MPTVIEIIYINQNIADRVIEIRQRKKIKLPDAIIAATALEKQCGLVTRNVDDFKNIHDELRKIDHIERYVKAI